MKDLHAGFMDYLVSNGWVLIPRSDLAGGSVSDVVGTGADAAIPAFYLEFLLKFKSLSNADESRWFISIEDFSGGSDSAFSWNEFERMSFDAAVTSEDGDSVREFWGQYLPILLGVDGDYQYIALSRSSGGVVHGVEPEFESSSQLAESFDAFLAATMDGKHDAVFFG